jgi:hypothetical protein
VRITYQRKGQLRADSCKKGKVTSLDPLKHSCPPKVSLGYVMDTLYSGDCDCANDFPSLMRARTWSYHCKCQYVLLVEELWMGGSLEFEHRIVRGQNVVTSPKGFSDMG